jgi:[NiFe] hydrogenase assembly HybE family chaperone
MTESARLDPATLADHFRMIAAERMQGLPIVNPRIDVEAVGFRALDEHVFGVLIAPWFMNMIVLPGSDAWSALKQGDKVTVSLPAGDYEFTVCRDEGLAGSYLSAVLFRTVTDFPDHATARDVALDIVGRLFEAPADGCAPADDRALRRRYSRRGLLSGRAAG